MEKYATVNGQWPADRHELPKLEPQEALSAAKRIYRKGMGKAWKGKWQLTSGNRHSWPRSGVFYINPDKGWHGLVHSISHWVSYRKHPNAKAHGPQHAFIEKELIRYVVDSGYLDGQLRRPAKVVPDKRQVKHGRLLARIERWSAKLRRAQRALAKLERQRKRMEA